MKYLKLKYFLKNNFILLKIHKILKELKLIMIKKILEDILNSMNRLFI